MARTQVERVAIIEERTLNMLSILDEIRKDSKEIKEQARLTNGRLRKLEIWRATIVGGLIVIATILIPLALEYFK